MYFCVGTQYFLDNRQENWLFFNSFQNVSTEFRVFCYFVVLFYEKT